MSSAPAATVPSDAGPSCRSDSSSPAPSAAGSHRSSSESWPSILSYLRRRATMPLSPGPAGIPPSGRRVLRPGFAGLDVLVLAALRERPAPAEQDGQVMVQMVPQPGRHPDARFQPQRLPGMPEGGEPGDGLGVLPPLKAPAVFAAEGPAEHRQELAAHPCLDRAVQRLRRGAVLPLGRGGAGNLRCHARRPADGAPSSAPPRPTPEDAAAARAACWIAACARAMAAVIRRASGPADRKSTRLNSSHVETSYA